MAYGGGGSLAAHRTPPKSGEGPPPQFLGWFFIAFGATFFLVGLTMAILILMSGRSIARRRRYWFAFVIACIECLFMPFGTALGVFTIIVLSRESVKKLSGVDGVMQPSGN